MINRVYFKMPVRVIGNTDFHGQGDYQGEIGEIVTVDYEVGLAYVVLKAFPVPEGFNDFRRPFKLSDLEETKAGAGDEM